MLQDLGRSLRLLHQANLFTEENFHAVKAQVGPLNLALRELHVFRRILTQANFDLIKGHTNPLGAAYVLCRLNDAGSFIHEDVSKLLQHGTILFSDEAVDRIWSRIPTHLLTQAVCNQLMEYAQQSNSERITSYLDYLLHCVDPETGFYDEQSTHIRSVHQSVSESAKQLFARYGSKLSNGGLETIVYEIEKALSRLSDTLENKAAKRCIKRITTSHYFFVDYASSVTTKELLALFYLAIQDDEYRLGSLEEAKKQLIRGLYEIQRGYNLSEKEADDGEDDKSICEAGAFNKLIEKLIGLHSDVELRFMSKGTAALKFPVIACEEVVRYLEDLDHETSESCLKLMRLIDQLQKEGPDIIWYDIKPRVADRLFEEFNSLFDNNRENPYFLDLLKAGPYVSLKDSSCFQRYISSLPAYHEYANQTPQHSMRFFQRKTADYLSTRYDDDSLLNSGVVLTFL